MRRVSKRSTVLFHEIFDALKQPIQGVEWMLTHTDAVQQKLQSPEWNHYLKQRLNHETPQTRRIVKRQLKLFLQLTKQDDA